ncbi:cytochrome P450 [Apodospora peruviana]|uniref:Cytochrome P450 n=1 Tax=Apodospora peruviana TaxID=516989 RepID=A0AAE0I5V1_9PEZI|nr:cytochrome P450 [Apodospora peruviana]
MSQNSSSFSRDWSNNTGLAWHQIASDDITAGTVVFTTVAAVVLLFFYRFSSPPIDPREPPLLKPGIPIVGHLVGLARYGIDYFEVLRNSKRKPSPAVTLPILNGKAYVLFDRTMIQSAIRHKNLTFDVLGMEFAQRVFGLSDLAMEKLWGPDHDIETSAAGVTMQRIKTAMTGQSLFRMNAAALNYIAEHLNSEVGEAGLKVPNLYRWLRDFMTMATAEGLYGSDNPIQKQPDLIDALWAFEGNMQPLFVGVMPKLIARKAYTNREKVQAALSRWYVARKDGAPDVAEITKVRVNTLREFDFPEEEIGWAEAALLFVATTNTIPTLYWFVTNVWLRPEVVEEVRREALPLVVLSDGVDGGKRIATLDITQLEERCPLLVGCYRESIRLGNQSVGTRRVLVDTVLTDGAGNQHLFKAGCDIMWSVKTLHRSEDVWGPEAMEFDPSRFVKSEDQDVKVERARKQAYVPFGGGKHLCPGRNFAFAENLGLMAALVVGFELHGLDAANVRLGDAKMGEAVAKPPAGAEGGEVVIKRRAGWEDVDWKFMC